MARTTTAVNACDVQIWLEDNGGNMVEISGSSNNVSLEFTRDVGSFKPFGSQWKTRLVCGKDATFSIDVVYSTTKDEGFQLLKDWYFNGNGSRQVYVDIPDSNTGSDRYEGSWVCENLSIPADSNSADPILVSVSLLPDDEVVTSEID